MEFPEDITVEILKRLPVKTLVRFKCVSKWWRSLINSPSFVKTHMGRIRSESHLGLASCIILSRYGDSLLSIDPQNEGPQQAMELDFPMLPYFPYYVKGHCDGLICCVVNDGSQGFLLLYNASIREYRKMPIPPNFRSTREVFGLGFDSSTQDYKIVRIPSMYCRLKVPGFVPKVEVFSLKSNSWRKLPDEDTPPYFVEHVFQATCANGGLYWLAEEGDSLRCVILRFDLSLEKFKVVPPPPDELNRNISWIGALKGQLCVLHSQRLSYVDVWGTKDDKTWTKLITIPRSQGSSPSVYGSRYTPLCYTKSGSLLISVGGEGFLTYEPVEKTFRQAEIRGAEHYLQETAYFESLVSPNFGNEHASTSGEEEEGWLADTTSNSSIRQLILGLRRGLSSKSSRRSKQR
ncbi:F-box domain containing protein [Parasponia andersonii]|uniref:F-box domain containing protein n=1 Tax=Parasponia andersonii TaxID=3476 RepID=A0A2P5A4E4_PARAD|nr:F-box domain containing protein [Parasponia andersonii]